MRSPLIIVAVLVLVGGAAVWRMNQRATSETFHKEGARPPVAGPMCPWRDPAGDMAKFFPGSTRYETVTRILSGSRLELTERLGRAPTGDENALHVNKIYREDAVQGVVMVGRIKGEYGAMEVVVAVGTDERVRGVRLQRLREPESISSDLQKAQWLQAFTGKRAGDPWRMGDDLPVVASQAKASAEAVVAGVRTLLVLYDTAPHVHEHSSKTASLH